MKNKYLLPVTKTPVGIINLPGSKSIANRVLPLAAIANGDSYIYNVPSEAEDVNLMLNALLTLGVKVHELKNHNDFPHDALNQKINSNLPATNCQEFSTKNAKAYKITGCGGKFANAEALIFCGNSGTTIRFLSAILAFTNGRYCLDGIARMRERPIADLVTALRQVGCQIDYLDEEGFPPLLIKSFDDNGSKQINLSGKTSSQYLTGILMALPLLKRQATVNISDQLISVPYVAITVALLKQFGYMVDSTLNSYQVKAIDYLKPVNYIVEPDASSASYFLAIGAIKGQIEVKNLTSSSLQGDRNFARVLAQMGANVEYTDSSIIVKRDKLNAIDINMEDMPDVAMTIAVLALFAKGTTTISGIHSWKFKETDRLQAMATELTKLGADVTINDSSITITPPPEIKEKVIINTYNDHRMAMCFALVAVFGIEVIIAEYECVAKTFPDFFDLFEELCYG